MIYIYLSVLITNRWLFHFNANSYQSNEEVAWFNSFISNYCPTYTVDINTCSTHYKHDDYSSLFILVVIKGVWKGYSYSLIEIHFKFNVIKCLELYVLSKSNINNNHSVAQWRMNKIMHIFHVNLFQYLCYTFGLHYHRIWRWAWDTATSGYPV